MENSLTTTESKKVVTQDLSQIEGWLKTRKEFIDKVASMAVEGKDFHVIKNSKSLAKGGAEKIASIFHWTAQFRKDTETLEMLGNPKDVIAYICELKNGEYVGEGRGARKLSQDAGDINKAIKMAQKSAYIDAVLRSSGLSDIFTQDLEDMDLNRNDVPQKTTGSFGGGEVIPQRSEQVEQSSNAKVCPLCNKKHYGRYPKCLECWKAERGGTTQRASVGSLGLDVPPFESNETFGEHLESIKV